MEIATATVQRTISFRHSPALRDTPQVLTQTHAKEKEIKVSSLKGMYLSSNDDASVQTLSQSPSIHTPKIDEP
jgi:hypothetical protein